jgi:hypothetical protein
MKLITEHNDSDIRYIAEAAQNGEKKYRIEGVFIQSEKPNRNKRIYRKNVLQPAVDKYITEQVNTGRAVGELNHPDGPTVNLDKVSHRITELKWNGNDVVGKALILNTPMGKIVQGLLEGGVRLGVSTRGMGSLEQGRDGIMEVKNDFHLATVDIVQDPSAPDAFVNGIMEGVEWVWDNGILKAQQIEQYETEIKNASSKRLAEAQLKVWNDFLSKL